MFKKFIILLLVAVSFMSCEKEEGEGGTSEIRGKVYVHDYTADMTWLEKEYYAPEEDVYIIYGDDEIYSDRFRTNYDGSFVFKNLQKGEYTIFVYSKNIKVPAEVEPIFVNVTIDSAFQTVVIPENIVIKK
jgi:hypothetical protein